MRRRATSKPRIKSYQSYEYMYPSTCDKPVHETIWWRHHIGILLGLLCNLFLLGELGAVVTGYLLLQSSTVRGWVEFGGHFESNGLWRRGIGGCAFAERVCLAVSTTGSPHSF